MNLVEKTIVFADELLTLTNQRVIFWARQSALILSDVHVGKSAHFRRHGIAVPSNVLEHDLTRVSVLINHFKACKIIIVGDLLHAGDNSDVDVFCEWRQKLENVEFHLVEGNHDRITKVLEEKLCMTSKQDSLELNGLVFNHDFDKKCAKAQVTGHIHPGVLIQNSVNRMRLPCYAVTQNQLLLPAFSTFTGLDLTRTPRLGSKFVFTDNAIYEL